MLAVHSIDILWKKCGTEYFINVLKKETFKTIGNILVLPMFYQIWNCLN